MSFAVDPECIAFLILTIGDIKTRVIPVARYRCARFAGDFIVTLKVSSALCPRCLLSRSAATYMDRKRHGQGIMSLAFHHCVGGFSRRFRQLSFCHISKHTNIHRHHLSQFRTYTYHLKDFVINVDERLARLPET